jgi:cytochrome P450
MTMNDTVIAKCPVGMSDDRKSAVFATKHASPFPGTRITQGFAGSREILRSADVRQAGGASADLVIDNPDHTSFFFLDGELHRKRRASVAGYFTPRAIINRYHPIINRTMDDVISKLQRDGSGLLDEMALALAVNVTAEILGVVNDGDPLDLAHRFHAIRATSLKPNRSPLRRFFEDKLFGWYFGGRRARMAMEMYKVHIAPAAEARRNDPKDDVVSYMVKEGYSVPSMIMECMTYGTAGVSTTREFIGMAAWHLFDRPELKDAFLAADEDGQFAILQEVLRLDPVSGFLYRRAEADIPDAAEGPIKAGDVMAISIRNANLDEEAVGQCPFSFDLERTAKAKNVASYMNFGDGPHRCPGSQVALHEGRMFLDRLMRVPGVRLVGEPTMVWNVNTQSYEIRKMMIACDKAA